jgi:hypothetical protein
MKRTTLWEALCSLSGSEGTETVHLDQALEQCAVNRDIAEVELRRLQEERLVELVDGFDRIRLTNDGRSACEGIYRTGLTLPGHEDEAFGSP